MNIFFLKIKKYVALHKVTSFIIFVAVAFVGYWGYGKLTSTSGVPSYIVTTVQKGTIVSAISGSGQVSASNQIDIKPKVSGDVVYVSAVNGQVVRAGAIITELDAADAQKAVRDAEVSLESAKLSLQKLIQPADALAIIQSENTLARAKESKQSAQDNLAKVYEDGFNTMANAFLDLPGIMTGLDDMFFKNVPTLASSDWYINWYADKAGIEDREKALAYKEDVKNAYDAARKSYDSSFASYKSVSRTSDRATIGAAILNTYDTVKIIADAVKTSVNYVDFVNDSMQRNNFDIPVIIATHKASLSSYTSKTNTHLLNLLNIKKTTEDSKQAIVNADRTIVENTSSLEKLKNGPDQLDIASSQLSVKQRENALMDAQEKLSNYFIRAPFDGTVAKMNAKKGDSASSGTIIATIITKQKIAEVSLNEVDVAKVKVGQKVTLTFDAVEGLDITGKVAEVDAVGTVTQGVVTYSVKINFDTQDDRIKSGMSTSAAIITDIKQDVLMVPNSAVKTQGGSSYVEMFTVPIAQSAGNQGVPSAVPPIKNTVEIGISNDILTEVISGLKEGDQVVSRTITPSATTVAATAPSLFGSGGGRSLGH